MAGERTGSLVVRGARVFSARAPRGGLRGEAASHLEAVEDGAVGIVGGRIAYVGPTSDLPADLHALPSWHAGGRAVLPGLVDAHTHVPFAAWRADEYAARLSGATYAAQQGGGERLRGIPRSAAQMDAAPDEEVLAFSARRLGETLSSGTTTLEMKSGYGLSVDAERRAIRLMAKLGARTPQRLVRTGLFLHGRPRDGDRSAWLGEVLSTLLPWAVSSGAIDGVDAFVEGVAYTLEEAAALLDAARRSGLRTHLHAEQLAPSGAAAWAAAHGITSVDHLDHLDAAGVRALGASATAAVLLPGATFLAGGTRKPPARDLIDRGALVALATDLNPGTAPVSSMPETIALACRMFDMRVDEAVAAATINAAAALGIDDEVGSLEVGKRGDLVVLEGDDPALLAYRLGTPAVERVVVAGTVAYGRGDDANAS